MKIKTQCSKDSLKKTSRCEDVNAQDVDEWLITDESELCMNDDEIVQVVLHDFNNTPFLKETEEPEERFHVALQTRVSFLEKYPDATLQKLMMVGNWHDFCSKKKKRICEPKQKVLTKFFPKYNLFLYTH